MNTITFSALAFLSSALFCSSQEIKGVKIAIENPAAVARPAADVVVDIPQLRKIAPDLTPASLIVTATNASTLEQDASVLEAEELPSQVDDLDGDGKADELAFQIDLAPHQTRIVTISYGDMEKILRIRLDYAQRTNALFSNKIEGLGWESERIAYRVYFDPRNAIDIWGKRRPSLQLKLYASPDYPYHEESPEGRDIFKVGTSIGIGGFAAWVDGKLVKAADVQQRSWKIIAAGPVRTIVELEYRGWKLGEKNVDLRSRIIQWAGERGFYHTITASGADTSAYVTGFPKKQGVSPLRSNTSTGPAATWLASWGEQVVAPGPAATESIPGQNLGLAVITCVPHVEPASDSENHLLKFHLENGRAMWYAMAAWDQEGTNRRIGFGNQHEMQAGQSLVLPPDGISTQQAFVAAVEDQAMRMVSPVDVHFLSESPAGQSAPPDTLVPQRTKSIADAIDLIRQNIDRTAAQRKPVLAGNTPEAVTSGSPSGFFTEADNKTGDWRPQEGFSWTGGFWIGELWQMYSYTHNEKYRRWAEEWLQPLLGQEMRQYHDVGTVYYHSAAQGFDLTKKEELRESALRAAERLTQLYNPTTHLIAAWSQGGDDTIIDTMMNLEILWWASDRTGKTKWRDLALTHALQTAKWMIRPNGSVIQSIHYNPGDNRQEFQNYGSALPSGKIFLANTAAPGDWVFAHTHQGFGADTAWSRGTGWALYYFTRAYEETKDKRLLAVAQRVADFTLTNLPSDGVPWYDFYDEGVHFRNRDSSAAAILAGGLLHLSAVAADKKDAALYRREGERIVHSLIDRYLTPVGAEDNTPPGVLRHGCYLRPNDAMLIFGQSYLLQDLLWITAHN
jgi:unsaturated chondroitin disaccharide hydrolase